MNPVSKGLLCGREIEYFHHPSEEAWGYAAPQEDTFAVIHPQKEDIGKKYPLFVVFHSAGHDVHSCIGCMPWIGNHDIYDAPPETFALVLDCWANTKTDWWWGGDSAFGAFPERNGTAPQPVERRCVDTILWVCGHFAVDTDRVYAVGNSMGGSGALGIGMRHGEIFAAVKANVPAGARHAAARRRISIR